MSLLQELSTYSRPGVLGTTGWMPTSVLPSGEYRFSGFGMHYDFKNARNFTVSQTAAAQATMGKALFSKAGLQARLPGNGWGLLLGLPYIYSGYQEGGLSGAYDALSLSVATEAALFKWSVGVGTAMQSPRNQWLQAGTKLAGHPLRMNSGTLMRGVGASIGGYIGQQLGLSTGIPGLGTVGAMGGSYFGAAPIRALAAHPVIGGALVAGATLGIASYGAYSLTKGFAELGYQRRQSMRGVNTDGDLSAFMTQGATTMRARAVQAISRSHMNARSALGQEANFMHMPQKNYNSIYR